MKLRKLGILFGIIAMLSCGVLACQSAGEEYEEEYVFEVPDVDLTVPSNTPVPEETPTPAATATPTATPTPEGTPRPTPDPTIYKPTAQDIVDDMVIGWNLGNNLDAWVKGRTGLTTETSWGNPVATKELVDAVKAQGFNTVRVPVTWYNHMDENNVIDPEWMARVEEVVNYVLENDMYCIINVHHDTGTDGWLKASNKDIDMKKEKFEAIWTQVADHFGDYGDELMFEGFNEILNEKNEWVRPDTDAVRITNELNQMFVDIVRASEKEKNKTRVLVVNTYCAGGNRDVTRDFVLPADTVTNKLIVGAHIYQPYNFTAESSPNTKTWSNNKSSIDTYIKNMYTTFVEKGTPVVISEFGAVDKSNKVERQTWLKYYVDLCDQYGIKCIWWDNGSVYKLFNRGTYAVTEQELINIMVTEAQGGDYFIDTTIYGDADGNGTVQLADLTLFRKYMNGEVDAILNCDINKDGKIDAADGKLLEGLLVDKLNLCANEVNWGNYINTSKVKAQITQIDKGRQIKVEKAGESPWEAQISYDKLTLEQNKGYKISFDYTGPKGQNIVWNVIQNYGDYATYFTMDLECNGETQHFETAFKMTEPTDKNIKTTFDCGLSTLGVPYTIQIQNLVLLELSEEETAVLTPFPTPEAAE